MTAMLAGVGWYRTVAVIRVSLVPTEHLFMGLLAFVSLFWRNVYQILCPLLTG